MVLSAALAQSPAPFPDGVRTLNPPGAIKVEGMFEARRLFDDDIIEIDSVFYTPRKQ